MNGQKILGIAPVRYGAGKTVRRTHNEDAITRKIWVPDLDNKFVPQGLTWASPYVLVGGYIWDGKTDDSEPVECRVYKVDPESGENLGYFTMGLVANGSLCRHAGGLACDGRGVLYVSDTHHVFKVDIGKAFKLGSAFRNEALLAVVKLGGEGSDAIVGSFAAWEKPRMPFFGIPRSGVTADALLKRAAKENDSGVPTSANPFRAVSVKPGLDNSDDSSGTKASAGPLPRPNTPDRSGTLWLGRYTEGEDREENTRIHAFPSSLISWADANTTMRTITAKNASASLWISAGSQGAAFDRAGFLWVSRTVTRRLEKTSVLHKKDPKTGDIVAKYNILHGLEDMAFDDRGNLWIVSESGTWRYQGWKVFSGLRLIDDFYPLLIRIDVNRLQSYD